MVKGTKQIIILELFVVVLTAIMIQGSFSEGSRWETIQFVTVLAFVGVLLPLRMEARRRKTSLINGKSVVLLGVFAWLMLDPLTLRESFNEFSPEVIVKGFSMVMLFLAMVYVGYLIRWPHYFLNISKKLDYEYSFDHKKLFTWAVLCFLLGFLPFIIWGGGLNNVISVLTSGGRFTGAWGRGAYGGWTDWLKTGLSYLSVIGVQLALFYTFFVKKNIFLIVLTFIVTWVTFQSGTRTALAALLLPGVLLYYLAFYSRVRKNKYWILILLYLLLCTLELQMVIRDTPQGVPIKDVVGEAFSKIVTVSPIEQHRDNQFYNFLKINEYVPNKVPHTGEWLILRPLYHFIPRAIWEGKPIGVTTVFERAAGVEGLTVSVSTIGEFYLCQGWLGVCIIGIFMGFLAKQFDSLIEVSKRSPAVLLMYCYGLIFLFVAIRSYQIVFESWYIFIILYFILISLKKKSIIKKLDETQV